MIAGFHNIPEGVISVNIEEQKVFDGLTFPLILSPVYSLKDKDSDFWNEWVKKNVRVIENLLFKYGAILFRGFPLDTPKKFDDFSKAYEYDPFFNVWGGGVRKHVLGNVYTVGETPPHYKIPMHHEMAQFNDYPHVLFFHCDMPAEEGGNTPLALSNIVYRMMAERDPDFVSRLEREGLRYSWVAKNGNDERNVYGRSWQSLCFTSNRAEAEQYAVANDYEFEWQENGAMKLISEILPAIRVDKRTGKMMWFNTAFSFCEMPLHKGDTNDWKVTFPNGDAMREESIETLRQVMDEVRVSFKWQQTDVTMIDNRITMHARDVFRSPPRRIFISFFKDHQGPI